jgi:leader peptidase (prepilin peptidase)/N-methyltransferase
MSQALLIAVALVLGLLIGYGTHILNQLFATTEEDADAPPLPLEWLWAPILDAGLLAFAVYRFGASPRVLLTAAAVVILVQVLVFDARHRLILNRVIYPAIALALLTSPINPVIGGADVREHVISSVLGGVVAGGLFFILTLITRGGLGLGDAKLAFFIGAVLGLFPVFTSPTLRALLYGVLLGGVVAVLLLITRRRGMRDFIPYGPYLCAGGVLALMYPCGLNGPPVC